MKTFFQVGVVVAMTGAIAATYVGNPASAAVLIGLAILFKLDAQAAA